MRDYDKESLLRLKFSAGILLLVLILGPVGFYFLEESVSFLDAVYYTFVTVSTVGYGDIRPLTPAGKFFTMALILLGVGSVFAAIPSFFEVLVKREIKEVLKLPKEQIKIKDHYIVCGWGKVGKTIVDELIKKGEKFVVIENNSDRVKHLVEREIFTIEGDARSEDILNKAMIETSKGLFATLDDATNVFVVLTAKIVNPEITIISKADYHLNEPKLRKAGADKIINCHVIGAQSMVSFI